MRIYREHLAEQAREEEKREREVDALVNSEVEKQWAKRLEQWRKEREARMKLMQDVLNERKKQVEEKREFNITIEISVQLDANQNVCSFIIYSNLW